MAQTAAQKLAAAKAAIAATKANIAASQNTVMPQTKVDTTSLAGIAAASGTPAQTVANTPLVDEQAKAAEAAAAVKAAQGAGIATQVPAAGTFIGWDYQGNTQSTGTLRRAIIADGKGGQTISTVVEKNPDYVSGSRGTGAGTGTGTGTGTGAGTGTGTGTAAATASTASADLIAKQNADAIAAGKQADRQSAYDTLYNEFNKYGLGSMVETIKGLITDSNVNPSQFALALQNTDAYKKRFSANQDRIAQGLKALTPAEYIGLEDQYQNIMRNYGLPSSYYAKDSIGTQAGFNKFIANDVSATELENRIATAQQRVINSNPEVLQALKQFYPDISNGDILAYTLDPKNGMDNINRKVTAAEIGGAALAQGLQANGGTAESLAGQGITKAQAQQGYTNVAGMVPRGSQLADIYGQTPYTQGTAEAEVFNTAGAAEATAKRKKLTGLETAAFSGSSGVGSLNRDRPISNYMLGQPGAGAY
jgi:hypothetical protein